MKKVLFIAYHFPPVGGAGVQRNSKFVRYLREFGYDPVVVTGPGEASARWMPSDETLSDDISPDLTIRRLAGPEPGVEVGWRERASRWGGVSTAWERWWAKEAATAAVEVGAGADVIYASLEPYQASAIAAESASRRLGIPWIADLQDPWALDEMRIYPSGLHLRRERRRMRHALESAAGVVMNTDESVLRVMEAFPSVASKPLVSIPNGFDAADFIEREPREHVGKFWIVHTGYLHTQVGQRQRSTARTRKLIGGAVDPRVDILTRSHIHLMEALDRVRASDSGARSEVELHLAGVLSSADRAAVGDRDYVHTAGYVTHARSLEYLASADLLFLPMQELPPGVRAGIVPGKTYEYIASGRPILAAVPEGDAHDLLERAGTAFFCRPSGVDCLAATITTQLSRWRRDESAPRLNREAIARWERRNLTAELAAMFDRVVATVPSAA